jgi:hypothetical protein
MPSSGFPLQEKYPRYDRWSMRDLRERTFTTQDLTLAIRSSAIVVPQTTIRAHDAMTWHIFEIVGAHDCAYCASSFRIPRFRRDFFVGHSLPFRDTPDDVTHFVRKGFHPVRNLTRIVQTMQLSDR